MTQEEFELQNQKIIQNNPERAGMARERQDKFAELIALEDWQKHVGTIKLVKLLKEEVSMINTRLLEDTELPERNQLIAERRAFMLVLSSISENVEQEMELLAKQTDREYQEI